MLAPGASCPGASRLRCAGRNIRQEKDPSQIGAGPSGCSEPHPGRRDLGRRRGNRSSPGQTPGLEDPLPPPAGNRQDDRSAARTRPLGHPYAKTARCDQSHAIYGRRLHSRGAPRRGPRDSGRVGCASARFRPRGPRLGPIPGPTCAHYAAPGPRFTDSVGPAPCYRPFCGNGVGEISSLCYECGRLSQKRAGSWPGAETTGPNRAGRC
jgi:hypothetical protein